MILNETIVDDMVLEYSLTRNIKEIYVITREFIISFDSHFLAIYLLGRSEFIFFIDITYQSILSFVETVVIL